MPIASMRSERMPGEGDDLAAGRACTTAAAGPTRAVTTRRASRPPRSARARRAGAASGRRPSATPARRRGRSAAPAARSYAAKSLPGRCARPADPHGALRLRERADRPLQRPVARREAAAGEPGDERTGDRDAGRDERAPPRPRAGPSEDEPEDRGEPDGAGPHASTVHRRPARPGDPGSVLERASSARGPELRAERVRVRAESLRELERDRCTAAVSGKIESGSPSAVAVMRWTSRPRRRSPLRPRRGARSRARRRRAPRARRAAPTATDGPCTYCSTASPSVATYDGLAYLERALGGGPGVAAATHQLEQARGRGDRRRAARVEGLRDRGRDGVERPRATRRAPPRSARAAAARRGGSPCRCPIARARRSRDRRRARRCRRSRPWAPRPPAPARARCAE